MNKIEKLEEAVELAWGLIANANNGDWESANPGWKKAAEKWRDKYVGDIIYSDTDEIDLPGDSGWLKFLYKLGKNNG